MQINDDDLATIKIALEVELEKTQAQIRKHKLNRTITGTLRWYEERLLDASYVIIAERVRRKEM